MRTNVEFEVQFFKIKFSLAMRLGRFHTVHEHRGDLLDATAACQMKERCYMAIGVRDSWGSFSAIEARISV